MAKVPKKPNKTQLNTINSISPETKSKKEVNLSYYQKNKERLKSQRRNKYQQEKKQEELSTKQAWGKYYQAEAIKVLMTFKEYTELSKEKKKLWQDFNWTLKDCQKAIKEGLGDIVAIMKLEQVANKLVRDYWDTAKSEEKQRSKNWNLLDYDEQQRLIRYWGYEKARIENGYIDTAEQLEKQSQAYLKELESAKFHEERGKVKCECWQCAESKRIQTEIKAKLNKEMDDYDQQNKATNKEQCPECGKLVKELDEEAGVCKSCKKKYE